MVDKDHIRSVVEEYFHIPGGFIISDTGVVDVQGDVYPAIRAKCKQIPVQFGKVSGHFICTHMDLETLTGSPSYVDGDFDCSDNRLTNLRHAPPYVERAFWCVDNPLSSLEGMPAHVGGYVWCTPGPNIPILRLLQYEHLDFGRWDPELKAIMKKYVHTDKPGAIKCAAELVRAGFKGNARW